MTSRRSLFNGIAQQIVVLQVGWFTNRSLVRSADCDSKDKNLVGSLDRFAKTAGSRDSVDSILTHVYTPNNFIGHGGVEKHVPYFVKVNVSP